MGYWCIDCMEYSAKLGTYSFVAYRSCEFVSLRCRMIRVDNVGIIYVGLLQNVGNVSDKQHYICLWSVVSASFCASTSVAARHRMPYKNKIILEYYRWYLIKHPALYENAAALNASSISNIYLYIIRITLNSVNTHRQANAMIAFVEGQGWNYISVVYEDDFYGVRGYTGCQIRFDFYLWQA